MNILVIGAGEHQIPGILKLKEKGYYVIAIDGDVSAEGRNLSDEFYHVDIKDAKAVINLLEDRRIKIDSSMCFSTEIALRTVAEVNEKYGLVGLNKKEVIVATDKAAQRKLLQEACLPTPAFVELHQGYDRSELATLRLPVIVKPTDNAGSRGVALVREISELDQAILISLKESKYDAKVVVEEFIPGIEFTVEALIIDGVVYILGISEKKKPINNYTVSVELFYNSPLVEQHRDKIESVIKPFLTKCGFNNTITHTEVIYSYSDHLFYVVETTVRSGGFHIFDKILPSITGLDIIGLSIDTLLGKHPSIGVIPHRPGILGFFYGNYGRIEYINIMKENLPNDCEYGLFVEEGDIIKDLSTDGSRLGYFITYGNDWKETYSKAREIDYAVKFEIV